MKNKNVKKIEQFSGTNILKLLNEFSSNLVHNVVYTKGIKDMNLIEIGPVVVEIQRVENSDLVVPVNNTLVCLVFLGCCHSTVCVPNFTMHEQYVYHLSFVLLIPIYTSDCCTCQAARSVIIIALPGHHVQSQV